jgi:hypothetical protein
VYASEYAMEMGAVALPKALEVGVISSLVFQPANEIADLCAL